MLIESADIVDQKADEVYGLVRDQMLRLVPYMPNIDRIEIVEREEGAEGPRIVNLWHAKSQLPAMISRFLSPELLSWKDRARWKDAVYSVDYELEGLWRPELYTCRGTNSFRPHGDGRTEVRVRVELEIYPERLPGIPKFIASRAVPAVEDFIKRLLQPNLTSLAKGLQAYIAAQR
jgi:hypothetical protein